MKHSFKISLKINVIIRQSNFICHIYDNFILLDFWYFFILTFFEHSNKLNHNLIFHSISCKQFFNLIMIYYLNYYFHHFHLNKFLIIINIFQLFHFLNILMIILFHYYYFYFFIFKKNIPYQKDIFNDAF